MRRFLQLAFKLYNHLVELIVCLFMSCWFCEIRSICPTILWKQAIIITHANLCLLSLLFLYLLRIHPFQPLQPFLQPPLHTLKQPSQPIKKPFEHISFLLLPVTLHFRIPALLSDPKPFLILCQQSIQHFNRVVEHGLGLFLGLLEEVGSEELLEVKLGERLEGSVGWGWWGEGMGGGHGFAFLLEAFV